VVALVLATVLTFGGVAANQFVSYDDGDYLTANPVVARGITPAGVLWAFTTTATANWHPLTWLSHMADVELFGMQPAAHHLVNLALHAANAVLLLHLLLALTGAPWRSAFVAALFALHPLHVESVAWAAERKDLLSTLFALGCLLAYVRAARRGRVARSLAPPLLFLLALLAKPMPISLPFLLLLVDWWPLGRWSPSGSAAAAGGRAGPPFAALLPPARLWLEKAAFFLIAVASAVLTLAAQHRGGAMDYGGAIPLARRAAHAVQAYWFYLGKIAWPLDLAVFYPYPAQPSPWWVWLGELLALAAVTAALTRIRRRHPQVALGWLWFLGTLVPVIGIVQVGAQAWADRYTYLPATGIFIAVSWGLGAISTARPRLRPLLAVAACAALVGCAALTRAQVARWRDSFTLFSQAAAATDGNWLAHNNLGTLLLQRWRPREAADQFRQSLHARPDRAETLVNLGDALLAGDQITQALPYYRRALELAPALPAAHVGLGAALERAGDAAAAAQQFAAAQRLDPASTDAAVGLARVRLRAGDAAGAAALLEDLLSRAAPPARAHTLYGELLARAGREREAEAHYRDAIRLSPDDPEGHLGLGALLAGRGDLAAAATSLARAADLKPGLAEAHYDLGKVLDAQGRTAEAVRRYRLAIDANPQFAEAHNNLGVDLLLQGDTRAGLAQLREALRLKPDYREARENLALAGARD
jgi:tetratricopeptide (TPR) repeat protein